MEIKVGEYVRLARNQGINKIIEIEDNRYILDDSIADEYGDLTCVLEKNKLKDEIVKHSKNIIDLIEIKDIVYLRNLKGDVFDFKAEIFDDKTMLDFKITIDCNEVKLLSIVTHEQFEQAEYKI